MCWAMYSLKDIVGHAEGLALSIEVFFLQIITIAAREVADGACGLGKNLKFAGCFDHSGNPKGV